MRRRGPARIELSERDRAILAATAKHRLITAGQIERLFFTGQHASAVATRRRCQAVLARLVHGEVLERLGRRQGGHAAGSEGYTYRVTARGRRAIGLSGRPSRYEPTDAFAAHTTACGELATQIHTAVRAGQAEAATVTMEPDCWRTFTTAHTAAEVLKPDLLVEVVTTDGWELRWWVEIDLATAHAPALIRKCRQYEAYWRSGAEPHDVYPRVLWTAHTTKRAQFIQAAITRSSVTGDLFAVTTTDQAPAVLLDNHNQPEGGDP